MFHGSKLSFLHQTRAEITLHNTETSISMELTCLWRSYLTRRGRIFPGIVFAIFKVVGTQVTPHDTSVWIEKTTLFFMIIFWHIKVLND